MKVFLTAELKSFGSHRSFVPGESIIKHKKSFQDGEIIKEAFVEAADSLFWDFKNKPEILSSIKALQLSRSTVTQRCEVMAEDLTQQLWKDITDCECFSLQLDESTDVIDTSQLCIFIWMVFTDMTAKEELLTILPMKEYTREEDIFQSFKNIIEKTQLSVCKLVSITNDGAPAMVGREWIYCQVQGGRCFPRLPQLPLCNTPGYLDHQAIQITWLFGSPDYLDYLAIQITRLFRLPGYLDHQAIRITRLFGSPGIRITRLFGSPGIRITRLFGSPGYSDHQVFG